MGSAQNAASSVTRASLPAPIPIAALDGALTEKTRFGTIPAIAPDGRMPVSYYARPYKEQEINGSRCPHRERAWTERKPDPARYR